MKLGRKAEEENQHAAAANLGVFQKFFLAIIIELTINKLKLNSQQFTRRMIAATTNCQFIESPSRSAEFAGTFSVGGTTKLKNHCQGILQSAA